MSLTLEQIAKIASLSRIKLTESEYQQTQNQLNSILHLIEQMQAVNTTDIQAMNHPFDEIAQRLRQDKVIEIDQRDQFQTCAPQAEEGLYLVPKVIE